MTSSKTLPRLLTNVGPLWIVALLAVALFLREARTLFVPIALAVLVSYALQPLVDRMARLRMPTSASAAVLVGTIALGTGWTGWVLSDDFARAARELPQQVRLVRADLEATMTGGVIDDLSDAASEIQQPSSSTASPPGTSGSAAVAGGGLANYLWQGSTSLFGLVGHITVVAFLTYFLLIGAPAWRARLIRLSGTVLSSRRAGSEVLQDITGQVQRFLLMRVVTSVVVGCATWIALLGFGAPAPALWATAAGVFNWVPYFGPIIVSGGLAIVGFVAGGMQMGLQLSLTALAITALEGWLLTPLLLGRAARMNTIAVFLSLLFWSWVWGIWGTILAVPLTSILKAFADHVEPLSWLSELLAEDDANGRPEPRRAGSST